MFLSFLITSHNETDSLDKLLSTLVQFKTELHEIILLDDYSDNDDTKKIIEKYKSDIKFYQKKLDRNYGAHKNYGISLCKGKWIFQIDADERPTDLFLQNINEILESNDSNEAIWIPRLNYFHGVTQNDIMTWGWNFNDGMINFPDYQSRLYKNLPYIRYERRLHEKVEGYKSYVFMPAQKDFALIHEKTIERQRETNIKYNQIFSQEENKGYTVK